MYTIILSLSFWVLDVSPFSLHILNKIDPITQRISPDSEDDANRFFDGIINLEPERNSMPKKHSFTKESGTKTKITISKELTRNDSSLNKNTKSSGNVTKVKHFIHLSNVDLKI